MLAALSIRDIVLIERLEIDFSRGLTVLTGETGAGKSILLDALSLALGGRGDDPVARATRGRRLGAQVDARHGAQAGRGRRREQTHIQTAVLFQDVLRRRTYLVRTNQGTV